jgi:hypothetical protein
MNYKIRIKSPEHSEKVQKHLFSLGYRWDGCDQLIKNTDKPFLVFQGKYLYWFDTDTDFPELELIETVSYELKEVPKKEVVTIGEKSYYKDELEVALKNINPI